MATFHAEHNKIKSLKNSFFQIIKQDNGYVNLNYNELNDLKNFFAGLSAENTSVTLAENQIKELPVGIFDGYSFYSLELSHNLITDISEEFVQGYVRIQIIWFDKNVFNGTTLRRLQSWSRRNNVKVKYFPYALIRNGAAGKFLSFAHNKIKSLENSFFQIIKQDNGYVNLNYNELEIVKKDFFVGLSVQNTSVTLGVNQIKELPVGLFDRYNFNYLDVSYNLITDISEEFLQGYVRIQMI
ncbi:hypothetical protein GEV33_007736 [Tenebrio molitor]|uniref:Uncharacterized protein n=1 Tax=Tenebrio molitor TaxID=7067 RepID=A0A8J6HI31_TENMO|nr:hypothetical protein GEV33_007736 [Tenebrio molitor]